MASSTDPRIERYIDFIIRRRWAVLIAAILVAVGVGTGARHLGLSTNYRTFFGDDNPDLLAFEAVENIYTKNDNVLFVVQPDEATVFNARTLEAVAELTERAWKIPYSTRVDSITNFQHTWAEEDDLVVEDLLPPGHPDQQAVDRVRQVSLTEPLLRDRLVDAEGRTTGINVRIHLPGLSEAELPAVVEHVRGLQAEFGERYPDHHFALTGFAMLNNAFADAPLRDMPVVMPLMFGVLVLVMALFLRSAQATGATLMLVTLSAITAVGAAGYAGVFFDPASASAPIIILTLAVADSIHILVTYFGALRDRGSKRDALVEAFRVNIQPVFLTSVTTAVGFLSLNSSDSPPFQLLGNVTAFRVMVAWAYSMTFLPAALAILPARAPKARDRAAPFASALAEFVVARPRVLLATLGTAMLLIVASIGTLTINDKFIEYFSPNIEFRQDTDFTMDNLTGIYQVSYSVESGESQGVSDPDYLRTVDEFADWNRARAGVVHVSTFTDTMKRLNQNMHGDDPSFYRLPDERELGAQYLLLYEMNLPYGLDVNDQINIDKSALRIDVTYGDVDTVVLNADARAAAEWFDNHGIGRMRETRGVGPAIMFSNITQRNIEGMLVGTGLGFAVISLILMAALRSTRLGLLSLVPNILPSAMAFGIWALLYREVGFAVSIVTGLSIGIIVDDTVHFLAKYQRARRELGYNAADAVRYAFEVVGPAIIGTSIIVAAGFAMLGLSTFRVTAYMGLLTSLAVICALVTDLFLLPSLLIVLDRKKVPVPVPAGMPVGSQIQSA